MPFRFMTAIEHLKGDSTRVRKAKSTLTKALDLSCDNIPEFDGDTLVVCDYSGSMGSTYNDPKGKGSLFGALLAKASDADFMIFGTTAAYVEYNPANPALTLTDGFMKNNSYGSRSGINVGHGTNFPAIFEKANKAYDRIVIFSDMQGWIGHYTPQSDFKKYCTKYSCSPKIYSFDLQGHGTMQFPEQDVYCLAGFSEKIFDIMKLLVQDRQALLNRIEAVQL